ncbi:MAG: hypothetical protein JWM99_5008 [Verrucomicrobiales bacterium]|nr:hypothetical protein [Verrucomicrobiales bacterium]
MILIERAIPDNADELSRISLESKSHWGYPSEWMAAWTDALRIDRDQIVAHATFVARRDNELIGFYLLRIDGEKALLEHLWVRPNQIGRGLGRLLFVHAVEQARTRGAKFIEIESDPNAEGFYRRLGAQRVGTVNATVVDFPREVPVLRFQLDQISFDPIKMDGTSVSSGNGGRIKPHKSACKE